ncbi:uncharacterized protein PpBr36_09983 [Pyricularia pennisetigena]|uniref:uncharacterized protein n=1 Tax=Pyricularia pennisetigena TaxID=1578925 RepID=UPI001152785E|nr:uncharacterized protein PpBr36_09983 [Pyricularia pennisetigena]TLS22184.1 hypothetical protein PpBr36_09983 [Pyricularia pennisetigena]
MADQNKTMRAWQLSGPGDVTKTLQLNDAAPYPSQPLKKGQVLTQVKAAAINPADYKFPALPVVSRLMVSAGKIPGMDCAGVVVKAGPDSPYKAGDRVFGRVDPRAGQGTLAEYTILEHEGSAKIADNVSFEQAAGANTAALTGLQPIAANIKEGSGAKVFVNGGAGGTGTYAIQIAKQLGCHVTATCSTAKAQLCKDLGADEIIDYKTSDVVAELKKKGQVFDLAVDLVGFSPGNLYTSSSDYLKPEAKYVAVGGAANSAVVTSMVKGLVLPGFLGGGKRKMEFYMTSNNHKDLSRISDWLANGKLKTVTHKTFPFEQVKEAYEELKTGRASVTSYNPTLRMCVKACDKYTCGTHSFSRLIRCDIARLNGRVPDAENMCETVSTVFVSIKIPCPNQACAPAVISTLEYGSGVRTLRGGNRNASETVLVTNAVVVKMLRDAVSREPAASSQNYTLCVCLSEGCGC